MGPSLAQESADGVERKLCSETRSASDGPKINRRPVKAKDVLTLAGVVLSSPVRVALGATAATFGAPVMLGSRAVRSVRKRLNPAEDENTYPRSNAIPKQHKGYDSRMILTGYPHQDRTGCISTGIKVKQRLRRIDQVIDADTWASSTLSPDTFSGLTLQSRIDFIAHGSAKTFAGIPANWVAKYLAKGGLKHVGVIRFDSCSAASGSFMAELGHELNNAGIEFGWIAGARSMMGDLRWVSKFGDHTYTWSPFALPWQKFAGIVTPEVMGRKIMKGNVNVDFKGTVYDSGKSVWRIASDYSLAH